MSVAVPTAIEPAAAAELAGRYIDAALGAAAGFCRAYPSLREDLRAAALLGLSRAAADFEPGRCRFWTFARHRVRGAMLDLLRSERPGGYRVRGAPFAVRSLGRADGEPAAVVGAEPDPAVGSELEGLDEVEGWLRKLPRRHAAAMRRLYVHGDSQAEAAGALGLSQSRLSSLHRESLELLRVAHERRRPCSC